jgi:uncharacterized membrane protein YkgB
MTKSAEDQKSNSSWTPLKLISAFIGVIETVMGVGVIQTTGGIQIALTTFFIVFTSLVAGVFFFLLWRKPEVLLTQPDFKSAAEGIDYIAALRGIVKQAESDASSIYASAEEMKLIAAQTKVSYEAIEGLKVQFEEEVRNLQQQIKNSEHRSLMHAMMLS